MTPEQLAALIGDQIDVVIGDLEQRVLAKIEQRIAELRGDALEKLFALRAPNFAMTPLGELYCDGKRVGDVRPMFKGVLAEVMAEQLKPKGDAP